MKESRIEIIKNAIEQGKYKIKDLCELVGIVPETLRNLLANHPDVEALRQSKRPAAKGRDNYLKEYHAEYKRPMSEKREADQKRYAKERWEKKKAAKQEAQSFAEEQTEYKISKNTEGV